MSNYVEDFFDEEEEEELFHSNENTRSRSDSPNPCESGNNHNKPPTVSSKKKRNLPGNPDPDSEVVALSPRTLMATNRYICEVCHKGFQRDQNLQLHRRGHNLPWKLKQRSTTAPPLKRRVYVCPEVSCVHHDPSRALGDLTGIKKHFCRKHGEKKWKCDKCSKHYAVQSDWKAHSKICGTREYRCDCGTIFSRKDSFVTHRAFCDALVEENNKMNQVLAASGGLFPNHSQQHFLSSIPNNGHGGASAGMNMSTMNLSHHANYMEPNNSLKQPLSLNAHNFWLSSGNLDPDSALINSSSPGSAGFGSGLATNFPLEIGSSVNYTSATALLQQAAVMGAKVSSDITISPFLQKGFPSFPNNSQLRTGGGGSGASNTSMNILAQSGIYTEGSSNLDSSIGYNNVSQSQALQMGSGFYPDSSMFLMSNAGGNSGGGDGRSSLVERELLLGGGGEGEKMTVDFLGIDQEPNTDYSKDQHQHSEW